MFSNEILLCNRNRCSTRKNWQNYFWTVADIKNGRRDLQASKQLAVSLGKKGTQSRVIYINGKMTIDLKETIVVNNLPDEVTGLYEHEHMVNTMANRFTSLDHTRTRYEAEIDYTKFIGIMPKLMALLMPGVFKKQVQKRLDSFKEFVEKD